MSLIFLKEALYLLTYESSTLNKTNLQYTLLVLESLIFMFHFKKTQKVTVFALLKNKPFKSHFIMVFNMMPALHVLVSLIQNDK